MHFKGSVGKSACAWRVIFTHWLWLSDILFTFFMYGHDDRVCIIRHKYTLGTQYSLPTRYLHITYCVVCLNHTASCMRSCCHCTKRSRCCQSCSLSAWEAKGHAKPCMAPVTEAASWPCLGTCLLHVMHLCCTDARCTDVAACPGQQITAAPRRTYPVGRLPGSGVFCRQPVHSVQLQHCSRLLRKKTHLQMQMLQQRMQPCRPCAHSGSQLNHVLCKQPPVAAMASLHNTLSLMVAWTTVWFSALVTAAAVRMQGTCRHALCPPSVQT